MSITLNSNKKIWGIVIICIFLMIPFFISCGSSGGGDNGGSGTESPETVKKINSYSDAKTDQDRVTAIQNIAASGSSVGVLDENGKQLNPSATSTDINFKDYDVKAFESLVKTGHYRTIGEVIDFLKDSGIVIASTGEAITFERVQQELQTYVNWSFSHKDNPDSLLGLLLASGPGMTVPASAPVIESSTQVSALTASLLLSDFLIGVNDILSQTLLKNSLSIHNSLSDIKEKLLVGSLIGTVTVFNDTILAAIQDGTIPIDEQTYEMAKGLLAAFNMGHQLRIGYCLTINEADSSCNMINPLELTTEEKQLTVGILLYSEDKFINISSIMADYVIKLSNTDTAGVQVSDSDKYDIVFGDGTKVMNFQSSVKPQKIITVKTSKQPTYNSSAILYGNATIIIPEINIEEELNKLDEKIKELKADKNPLAEVADAALSLLQKGKPQLASIVANKSLRSSSGSIKINVKGQSQALDVSISADPQSTYVNEWVFFDSTVTGGKQPYLYKWEFGDNESSTLHDDTHRYGYPGIFTVKLTVTDDDNNSLEKTLQVSVSDYADEYVVYYTDNVRCWDAPWLYVGSRVKFNTTEYRCDQPGGGIDCSQELIKTEIQGGFLTSEAAYNWICPKISAWHYHYWCDKHWVVDGQSLHFRLGLACDTSTVPEIPFPEGG